MSKLLCKEMWLPFLHVDELVKDLSDRGMHGWCGLDVAKNL